MVPFCIISFMGLPIAALPGQTTSINVANGRLGQLLKYRITLIDGGFEYYGLLTTVWLLSCHAGLK